MMSARLFRRAAFLLAAALTFSVAGAVEHRVSSADQLDDALIDAEEGDVIILQSGVYRIQAEVDTRGITLRGEPGAVIDAGGKGTALVIRRPRVRVENLTLRGYGPDLYARDAGVKLTDGADDAVLAGLTLEGAGFGVRADRLERLRIENCSIAGDAGMHVLDRGDGVFLNYVKDPVLVGNRVRNVRDGFYFENVDSSVSERNTFTGAQYGIHYMYTRGDSAADNRAAGVRGGYALMSSKNITLRRSTSSGNIEFGILLNVADGCLVEENSVSGVHNPKGNPALDTEGKGIFIYGPGRNRVTRNLIEKADIGIGVALGGEGNVLWENAFVENTIQVRYVGEKPLEWSHEGRGNFWSTYLGWDLDHDGIGDRPYQPNDSLDRIFWIYPEARFLMDSPVVALLRWLANQFEIDRGKGVTDSSPLTSLPEGLFR